MVRFSVHSQWCGFIQWYLNTLPDYAHLVMENRLPDYFQPALLGVLSLMVAYFVWILMSPNSIVPAIASVMTVILLVFGLW